MFKINVDPETLNAFGQRFRRGKQTQVKQALDEIRAQWQLEFVRQQKRLSKTKWPLLSIPYLLRKNREYSDRARFPEVKYTTTLKRSGRMLDGYIQGIQVNTANYSVNIKFPVDPFGSDKNGIRAKAHQGVIGRPRGMPARPFELEKFQAIGKKILTEALKKK